MVQGVRGRSPSHDSGAAHALPRRRSHPFTRSPVALRQRRAVMMKTRRVHEIALIAVLVLLSDCLYLFDVLGSIGDLISRAHHVDDHLRTWPFLILSTTSFVTGLVLVMRSSAVGSSPPYRSYVTYCAALGIWTFVAGALVHDLFHMEELADWLFLGLPVIGLVGPLCLWCYRRRGVKRSNHEKARTLALESVICLLASLPLSVIAYAGFVGSDSCYLGPLLLPLGWHIEVSPLFILPRAVFLLGIWCGIRTLLVSRKPRPPVVITASILGVVLASFVIVTKIFEPFVVQ